MIPSESGATWTMAEYPPQGSGRGRTVAGPGITPARARASLTDFSARPRAAFRLLSARADSSRGLHGRGRGGRRGRLSGSELPGFGLQDICLSLSLMPCYPPVLSASQAPERGTESQ